MAQLTEDAYRRRVLRSVEDRILRGTGNRFERLELLDASGATLWAKRGEATGVEVTDEEVERWRGRAYLATHNHPTSLPFTVGDVLAAIALDVQELNAFGGPLMATPAKGKARKTAEGARPSLPPVPVDTRPHAATPESLPNWDSTRRALVLDAYDPGTEYIHAAAGDEAAGKLRRSETAAELNQQGMELADAVEAESRSKPPLAASRDGKKR